MKKKEKGGITKMKKTYFTFGILIVFLFSVLTFQNIIAIEDLGNGTYILTETEFTALTDNEIANYMSEQLQISNARINNDVLEVYYNVVHIEPTHVNNTYRVFNHPHKTTVSYEHANYCLTNYNLNVCVQYLVTNDQSFTIDFGYNNETGENETMTIVPTYAQAYSFATQQYHRTIKMRDELSKQEPLNQILGEII